MNCGEVARHPTSTGTRQSGYAPKFSIHERINLIILDHGACIECARLYPVFYMDTTQPLEPATYQPHLLREKMGAQRGDPATPSGKFTVQTSPKKDEASF